MQIVGWCRLWEASKFRVYHVWQLLQNGYLVGMWINTVQVGPHINGAGILSVDGGKLKSTLAYFITILAEKEHTGTVITKCVHESVNECVSENTQRVPGNRKSPVTHFV